MQLPALTDSIADAPALARGVLAQDATPMPALAAFLGAPAVELEASPVSARIALMAANEGRCFVHHEHRLSPLLPEDARPELDVGLEEEVVPEQWREGVLHVPKYFSAFLEAPLPVFHPAHRAKWRPHELLHKLARFAWRPDITRFEAYLTARISELLPVVHWYGFDELRRHTCEVHRGVRPGRTLCHTCERGLVPFWQAAADPTHTERTAARALTHLQTELDACARELTTGRTVSTPQPGLDASSDAVGYLRGHWNRITAWSFGAWIERFTATGVDRFETCADHLAHVRELTEAMLCGSHALAPEESRLEARERHTAADLGYRVLLYVEALDRDDAEDALMPMVDALAEARPCAEILPELAERLRDLDPATADRPLAGGWPWLPVAPGARTSLAAGIRTALPRALEGADVHGFAEADQTPRPVSLAQRVAEHLATLDAPLAARARFEAWVRAQPTSDLEAERFGAVPEDTPAAGIVRCNETLRRGTFPRSAVDVVLGAPSESEAAALPLAAILWDGEPRVLEETPEIAAGLDAATRGELAPTEVTHTLLERGFIVWLPPVR